VTDLAKLDATAQAELVRSGDASPIELVDAAIERIEKLNGELNAVIHPLYERARANARNAPTGPFTGVPIVLKDLDGELAGAPLHQGNIALKRANHVATTTSYLFEKLEQGGFIVVGKTNTPEFGLMTTTEPVAYGATHNPWNLAHTPGGSSGGSAAAVASGMVPVGHAGDGGGSIRIPSSMCGLFGLKPSRARVSLGPSESESWAGLVHRHVVTRSVRDSAAVLDLLQGYMPGDFYSAPAPGRPYAQEVDTEPKKLRIGIRTNALGDLVPTDPECVAAAQDVGALLESLGHTVDEASPAALDDVAMLSPFTVIMVAAVRMTLNEIATTLGRPITPDDVEPMTWGHYEAAAAFDAGAYVAALKDAHAWTRQVVSWWFDGGYDLLLTPTCGEPPPMLGDLSDQSDGGQRSSGRQLPFALFTAPFNVTGQPAMSVPTALSASGLPIGVQLVGAPYREDVLFQVAGQIERARPWHDRIAPVHA
jgi:amidase